MEVIGPWEFKDWEMDGVGQFFKPFFFFDE